MSHARNKIRKVWRVVVHAGRRFMEIDGAQWAGDFAFHAFFSLFPLTILLVTIASTFVGRAEAHSLILDFVTMYLPSFKAIDTQIIKVIDGVIENRGSASIAASIMLIWGAVRFFPTLVEATNRAWEIKLKHWWRLPLKSLLMLLLLGGGVLLSIAITVVLEIAKNWLFPEREFVAIVYTIGNFLIPLILLFVALSFFYRLAPSRDVVLRDVWMGSLITAFLLELAQGLFLLYLNNSPLNAVYGAVGGIVALMLWTYFGGSILIYGACLCASMKEVTDGETGKEKKEVKAPETV